MRRPWKDRSSGLSSAVKLGAYGVSLVAVLGAGAAVGAAIGPDPSEGDGEHGGEEHAEVDHDGGGEPDSPPPAGVAVTQDGYTFDLRTRAIGAGATEKLEFALERSDGRALEEYEVAHDKELHLVLVARDLTGYAHVHPERADDGTWSVMLPPLDAGSYRVYADFVPAGHPDGLTLAHDLTVTGTVAEPATPAPSRSSSVDGYDVEFGGDLVPGAQSELTVTVSRDGRPVDDLQPYLGALGHLVAIRDGDLAYLHVHPLGEIAGPRGPAVRFAVEVPTAGTYGLFFDFSHGDQVRTASVIATAGDHGEHGG